MKFIATLTTIILSLNILSQTIIWSEDFESYTDGTQQATKWTTNANNCDGDGAPGTSADNYWGTRTTGGDKEFCCEDIEGLTCCGSQGESDNEWVSEVISIVGYPTIAISIDMRAEGDMECHADGEEYQCGQGEDLFNAEYQVDGGAWINFLSICGFSDGDSLLECIDVGAGSTLRVRVLLGNQANSEEYYFDDIFVYEDNCSTVLPIQLLSFTGEYNPDSRENNLHWITASETNNDYFTIEHSSDGISWEKIITTQGAGSSSTEHQYRESHLTINNLDYYRLTQTDFNGDSETFKIISIDKNLEEPEYVKYYNLMGQELSSQSLSGIVIVEKHFKSGRTERVKKVFSAM